MKDRADELARAVARGLRELIHERLAQRGLDPMGRRLVDSVDLRLRLDLGDVPASEVRFARALIAGLDEILDDARRHADSILPGHVYCHRCGSVDCEHSEPQTSRQVFAGYAPTGLPRWVDFAQLCLERRHPHVDRLYEDRPAVLTIVQGRDSLNSAMLRAFMEPRHELLGQVLAGFFDMGTGRHDGRGVVALSVQIAATHMQRGKVGLALNVIGRAPSGAALEWLWEEHEDLPWHRSVGWARAALETVVWRTRGGMARRVDGILQGLARRLEREHRARSRRTAHAARRHATGERPTRKAVDDARTAAVDTMLIDRRAGTMVVLGDRGRTHFFTLDGQHVTSVRYSREAIERKRRAEVWDRAPVDVVRAFRARLPG